MLPLAAYNPRRERAGVTLAELLVTVAVLVIVTAALIPTLNPLLEDRAVREAARGVHAIINGAQAQAAELERPVGILLERHSNDPQVADLIFLARTPPPYAGATEADRAVMQSSGPIQGSAQLTNAPPSGVVQSGDRIRFQASGPLYKINSVIGNTVNFTHDGNAPPPPKPTAGYGVTFQIFTQPKKASLTPMNLPGGMVVDLEHSGLGLSGTEFSGGGSEPVIITFDPTGGVEAVYVGGARQDVTGPIHLLVTQRGGSSSERLDDNRGRWVTINHQNGLVTISANVGGSVSDARGLTAKVRTAND